jgi:hypothetical protein
LSNGKAFSRIIDLIVSFLPGGLNAGWEPSDELSWAPYATISHRFYRAIQRVTFKEIEITIYEFQLHEQRHSPFPQAYLRNQIVRIILPAIDQA